MDWLSLIPAGISLLSGLFGGKKETTSKTGNSPELDAAAKKIMTEAGKVFAKPYQAYPGQRVAPTTASRGALGSMMGSIGNKVQGGLNDASGLQARARELMGIGPQRVSIPTMVSGGPQASMNAQPSLSAMPTPAPGSPFTLPDFSAPAAPPRVPYVPPPAPVIPPPTGGSGTPSNGGSSGNKGPDHRRSYAL